MRLISRILMIVFVAFVLLQFVLLQYVANNLPPQLEFQSNFIINDTTPSLIEETAFAATIAPIETTPYTPDELPRGMKKYIA